MLSYFIFSIFYAKKRQQILVLFIDVDFILNFNAHMVILFNEFDDVSAAVFDELVIMCHNDD